VLDDSKYCCKLRKKGCDEKYPKILSSLTPGAFELIRAGDDSLAACPVAEALKLTTATTTTTEKEEDEVEEQEAEDEDEPEALDADSYEDVSAAFSGKKVVALESGL